MSRRLSTIDYRLSTNKNGQSLIEVLVAFAVSVVIGIALITAGLATQKSSIAARNESQATKLAQEYIEEARVVRDVQGYSYVGTTLASGQCYTINTTSTDPLQWTMPLCPGAAGTSPCTDTLSTSAMRGEMVPLNNVKFCRKILVNDFPLVDTTKRKVTAEVGWMEGADTRITKADTIFSKWCEGSITGTSVPGVCP